MENNKVRTNFLVSFQNLQETTNEIIERIDILDLKNPSLGSIGAWKISNIKKAISLYKSKVKISATLGDIFCNQEFIKNIEKFDCLNLDFIKFGLLSKSLDNLFQKIDIISLRKFKTDLVCVVFVDKKGHLELVSNNLELLNTNGIDFLLLDTFKKNECNLLSYCNFTVLKNFIFECKRYGIHVGLAGRLNENHLPSLIPFQPNVIGFRSAVCSSNKRDSLIDRDKVYRLSSFFKVRSINATERAGA